MHMFREGERGEGEGEREKENFQVEVSNIGQFSYDNIFRWEIEVRSLMKEIKYPVYPWVVTSKT